MDSYYSKQPMELSAPGTSWAEVDSFVPRGDCPPRSFHVAATSSHPVNTAMASSPESGLASSLDLSAGDVFPADFVGYNMENSGIRDPFHASASQRDIRQRFDVVDCKGVLTFTAVNGCTGTTPDNPELYIKSIPTDSTPCDLIRFLEKAGALYKLRFMMDESNHCRGFAYATYITPEATRIAIEKLDDQPFSRWSTLLQIGLCQINRRIFVGGIPVNKTKDDAWRELVHKGVGGIVDVIMYRSYHNRAHNRGFVFVEFRSHQQAALGRRILRKSMLWGRGVIVDWSIPNPEASEEVLSRVKILFIRNLDVNMERTELVDFIRCYVSRDRIEKVYKFKDYAFVHLFERSDAEMLMQFLKRHFRNSCVEVHWANPSNALTDPQHRLKRVAKQTNCPKKWTRQIQDSDHENQCRNVPHLVDIDASAVDCYGYSQRPFKNRGTPVLPTSGHAHIDFRTASEEGSQIQVCCNTSISGRDFHCARGASPMFGHCPANAIYRGDWQTAAPFPSEKNEMIRLWMQNCENAFFDNSTLYTNSSQVPVHHLARYRNDTPKCLTASLPEQNQETEGVIEMNLLIETAKNIRSKGTNITLQMLLQHMRERSE